MSSPIEALIAKFDPPSKTGSATSPRLHWLVAAGFPDRAAAAAAGCTEHNHQDFKDGAPLEPEAPDVMAALSQWVVTDEHVQQMEQTRFIYLSLIASGHLISLVGPAGSGKTQVATHMAGALAGRYKVFFFQEDASAGDLPAMREHAKQHGYTLLNSTLAGSSTSAQLDALNRLVHQKADLSEIVCIFDTLKKYLDLMSKGGAREFFRLMRDLTLLGATVILLGHTNKHLGIDGKPVFEGVGDVRNDVDELFYLDATEKDQHGVKTLTLRPDKARCAVQAATFALDTTDMTLRELDRVVDVQEMERAHRERQADAEVIHALDDALAGGGMNRTELLERASAVCGQTVKTVRRVLDRYSGEDPADPRALWMVTHLRLNNTRRITLKPGRVPPLPNRKTIEPAEPAKPAEPSEPESGHPE